MKTTIRLAIISVFAVYLLIFTGGLVRVSGAGLGCPDWPRCFGRWIPPISLSQIPSNIDPGAFNLTLAWIEYLNRLFGMLVGLLVATTAILTFKFYGKFLKIVLPVGLAALLIALVGWQGGKVVESSLAPLSISAHMLLALSIAILLLYGAQQASYHLDPSLERTSKYPKNAVKVIGWLWLLSFLQVISGSRVRGMLQIISEKFPTIGENELLNHLGAFEIFHFVIGLAVTLVVFFTALTLIRSSKAPSNLVFQGCWGLLVITVGQVLLGMIMFIAGPRPLAEVLHLWLAALLTGVLLVLYSAMKLAQAGRSS
jgi:heme a synthase